MEEENFSRNTEGFTQEKLFSSGFSPISLSTSTENSSLNATAGKQNDLEREKWIWRLLTPFPVKGREHQKEMPANHQKSSGSKGCMTLLEIEPSNILSLRHPVVPLVCRILESHQFFPSLIPIINNHNLAYKRAIPSGFDKRSWHLSNPSHLHCFILFVYWSFYACYAKWHLIIQLN